MKVECLRCKRKIRTSSIKIKPKTLEFWRKHKLYLCIKCRTKVIYEYLEKIAKEKNGREK